eukprot:4463357-Pyramimonas_sp.AAC.1
MAETAPTVPTVGADEDMAVEEDLIRHRLLASTRSRSRLPRVLADISTARQAGSWDLATCAAAASTIGPSSGS